MQDNLSEDLEEDEISWLNRSEVGVEVFAGDIPGPLGMYAVGTFAEILKYMQIGGEGELQMDDPHVSLDEGGVGEHCVAF